MPNLELLDDLAIASHIRIPMSDGVELDADLYLPEPDALTSGRRWPIVIWYDPYRKDDTPRQVRRAESRLARSGFIVATIDVRGTGSSGGTAWDEYTAQEQSDGVEMIAWLAAQPWSNGNVGMYGSSYSGFNSLQVASLRPPALKAIAPMYFTDDRYTDDCHYKGGAMQMIFDISSYGLMMVPRNALPPDPAATGADWARIWQEHLRAEPWMLHWIEHQVLDDYWRNGSIDVDYSAIECATFLIGGWRDGYANTNLRTFEHLTCPKKVLIGPWLHSLPDNGSPGPRIDHAHELVRFFSHWLAGEANGVMDEPPVTLYIQEYDPPDPRRDQTTGSWRHEATWPLERSTERRLALAADGLLAEGTTTDDAVATYQYDPAGGTSFAVFSASAPYLLPADQRAEDASSLNWTTRPLADPLEILGRARAELRLSVTSAIATAVVRLIDVAPDGSAALVAKGVLNLTHRDSHEAPTPLVPDAVYDVVVELDATAWVFARGHRVRIGVGGADFPNTWPSPHLYDATIHLGGGVGSRLVLPEVGPATTELPAPALRAAAPIPTGPAIAGSLPTWRVTRDHVGGATEVAVGSEATWAVRDGLTVRSAREAVTRVEDADPAHAYAKGRAEIAEIRPGQTIEAKATGEIRSDAGAFHASFHLEVSINDRPVHSATWTRSFPRRLL